eukprot:scaffold6784_cov108-Cylindrotheca_fusiformis.AAC.9
MVCSYLKHNFHSLTYGCQPLDQETTFGRKQFEHSYEAPAGPEPRPMWAIQYRIEKTSSTSQGGNGIRISQKLAMKHPRVQNQDVGDSGPACCIINNY